MSSLTITTRQAKSGARYVVRYRLGGRAWPIVHAGSFQTMKEARARRDFVAGEIAAGRDPVESLRALRERPPERTLEEWGEAMVSSRLDVSDNRIAFLRLALRTRINPTFGTPTCRSGSPHSPTSSLRDRCRSTGRCSRRCSTSRRRIRTPPGTRR